MGAIIFKHLQNRAFIWAGLVCIIATTAVAGKPARDDSGGAAAGVGAGAPDTRRARIEGAESKEQLDRHKYGSLGVLNEDVMSSMLHFLSQKERARLALTSRSWRQSFEEGILHPSSLLKVSTDDFLGGQRVLGLPARTEQERQERNLKWYGLSFFSLSHPAFSTPFRRSAYAQDSIRLSIASLEDLDQVLRNSLVGQMRQLSLDFHGAHRGMILGAVPDLPRLKTLQLSDHGFLMNQILRHTPNLRHLQLSRVYLQRGTPATLLEVLPTLQQLRVLNLTQTNLDHEECSALGRVVRAMPRLKELRISENYCGKLDGQSLADLARNLSAPILAERTSEAELRPSGGLKVLEMAGAFNSWGPPVVTSVLAHFVSGLAEGSRLEKLDLSRNPFGEEGIRLLASRLGGLRKLRQLSLRSIGLNPEGVRAVIGSLSAGLETLDLSGNALGDAGPESVAHYLQLHPGPTGAGAFTELSLSGDGVTDAGVITLASVLRSTQLQDFNLSETQITPVGLGAMLDALAQVPTLRQLSLRIGPIVATEYAGGHAAGARPAVSTAQIVANWLRNYPGENLLELRLHDSGFNAADEALIQQAIVQNPRLQNLQCDLSWLPRRS